jgi:glutathione S-transferase
VYRHLGWPSSPYSAKTRSYLRFKGIPFEDVQPTAWGMYWHMQRRLGFVIMPIVLGPKGELLQDTAEIIDTLEARHPERPILPTTPRQRLTARLLALWADEWLPIWNIHFRWSLQQNVDFAIDDFSAHALPFLPSPLRRPLGRRIASKMQRYLKVLGVSKETIPAIEAWTHETLDLLDEHLATATFLLGDRPTTADFAVYGPIYAHLYRDPGTTSLVTSRPHLLAWLLRMENPSPAHADGALLPDDEVSKPIQQILRRQFEEQFPVLKETVERVGNEVNEAKNGKLPRGLGKVAFHIGEATGERVAMTFQQWKLQRVLDEYQGLEESDRATVDAYLHTLDGLDAMQIKPTARVKRERYRIVAA